MYLGFTIAVRFPIAQMYLGFTIAVRFPIAQMYLRIINHKLISHWTDVLKNHKP